MRQFTESRRELARLYFKLLDTPALRASGLGFPPADFTQANWHMFQVVLPEGFALTRAEVMARLQAAGIGSGVHYPAIHLFALYRRLGWKEGDFPKAESVCRRILTLPLFPTMTEAEVGRVSAALSAILSSPVAS